MKQWTSACTVTGRFYNRLAAVAGAIATLLIDNGPIGDGGRRGLPS